MKNFRKILKPIFIVVICITITVILLATSSCEKNREKDIYRTIDIANTLQGNQPTPDDIDYSLERYNLIRRTYWVNGQREKAISLPCEVERPLGYIVLFSGSAVVGHFVVDGKVTCLNSFLTPESYYVSSGTYLSDVDGSYGQNDEGIFFFTPDGKYVEWTGDYLYSDIPFEIDTPVVRYSTNEE